MSKKYNMQITGTPAELARHYCKQHDINLFVDKSPDTDIYTLYAIFGDDKQAQDIAEFDANILYEVFFNEYLRDDNNISEVTE